MPTHAIFCSGNGFGWISEFINEFILVIRIRCHDLPNENIPWERSGTLAPPASPLAGLGSAKLNFFLPVASQLLHPDEMCLNSALSQIAEKLY